MVRQQGMVLVITLLFLYSLTLIILNSVEVDLLESKIQFNFYQDSMVFQAAEAGLVVAEAKIRGDPLELPNSKVNIQYVSKTLAVDRCHKKRYHIDSVATYQGVRVNLSSEYEWLGKTSDSACQQELGGGRVYWGNWSAPGE